MKQCSACKIFKPFEDFGLRHYASKLRKNVSRAVNNILKSNRSNKKRQSVLKYLNYTMEDLKSHIESQFSEELNWNNYGKIWELNHIMPQSDLPYFLMEDDGFKVCWSLSNLRLLDLFKNRSEGSLRTRHKKVLNKLIGF